MRPPIRKTLQVLAALVLLIGGIVLYNYLRHVVFWFPTESVAFESEDGVQLRGTLIKPSREGVFPVVVVLHGSGPESRKELTYHVIANAIVRSGLAVLIYDKRGVGESGGDFETALYRDFVTDGVAAVRFLAEREDIDAGKIGLQGNSESGWLTPEIAYKTGQVAFIFNRAGPPLPWRDSVIWEVRSDLLAAGVAEDELEPLLDITMRCWSYYVDVAAAPGLAAGAERSAINAELNRLIAEFPAAAAQLPDELPPYEAEKYEMWAADIGYDPRPYLEAISVPMIYTFGETDINVPTAKSVAFLESFREQHAREIDIVVFEGVGHPMANWTGIFTAGYVPEFIELLGTWFPEQADS